MYCSWNKYNNNVMSLLFNIDDTYLTYEKVQNQHGYFSSANLAPPRHFRYFRVTLSANILNYFMRVLYAESVLGKRNRSVTVAVATCDYVSASDRSENTLTPVISVYNRRPGPLILFECWRPYNKLRLRAQMVDQKYSFQVHIILPQTMSNERKTTTKSDAKRTFLDHGMPYEHDDVLMCVPEIEYFLWSIQIKMLNDYEL